jgi:hypothetical protein
MGCLHGIQYSFFSKMEILALICGEKDVFVEKWTQPKKSAWAIQWNASTLSGHEINEGHEASGLSGPPYLACLAFVPGLIFEKPRPLLLHKSLKKDMPFQCSKSSYFTRHWRSGFTFGELSMKAGCHLANKNYDFWRYNSPNAISKRTILKTFAKRQRMPT